MHLFCKSGWHVSIALGCWYTYPLHIISFGLHIYNWPLNRHPAHVFLINCMWNPNYCWIHLIRAYLHNACGPWVSEVMNYRWAWLWQAVICTCLSVFILCPVTSLLLFVSISNGVSSSYIWIHPKHAKSLDLIVLWLPGQCAQTCSYEWGRGLLWPS